MKQTDGNTHTMEVLHIMFHLNMPNNSTHIHNALRININETTEMPVSSTTKGKVKGKTVPVLN
jgi:hypothetical protein